MPASRIMRPCNSLEVLINDHATFLLLLDCLKIDYDLLTIVIDITTIAAINISKNAVVMVTIV